MAMIDEASGQPRTHPAESYESELHAISSLRAAYAVAFIHVSSVSTPLQCRSMSTRQIERRVDEADVRERLRKVAGKPLLRGIVPLRQQAHIVANRQQSLEHARRVVMAAEQLETVHEPEAAQQERRLTRRE